MILDILMLCFVVLNVATVAEGAVYYEEGTIFDARIHDLEWGTPLPRPLPGFGYRSLGRGLHVIVRLDENATCAPEPIAETPSSYGCTPSSKSPFSQSRGRPSHPSRRTDAQQGAGPRLAGFCIGTGMHWDVLLI